MNQNSCQNLALVGWAVGVWGGVVLGGGCAAVWRAGGGVGLALVWGGRASCVLSLMFSFMYTNKVFFQSLFALLLSAAVSSQVSSFRFFAR